MTRCCPRASPCDPYGYNGISCALGAPARIPTPPYSRGAHISSGWPAAALGGRGRGASHLSVRWATFGRTTLGSSVRTALLAWIIDSIMAAPSSTVSWYFCKDKDHGKRTAPHAYWLRRARVAITGKDQGWFGSEEYRVEQERLVLCVPLCLRCIACTTARAARCQSVSVSVMTFQKSGHTGPLRAARRSLRLVHSRK